MSWSVVGYVDCTKSTPGWIRTNDHRFRKPVLYPLSYEGDFVNEAGS